MITTPELKVTRSGRVSKRPRETYTPDDFEDAEGDRAESGEEEEEDEVSVEGDEEEMSVEGDEEDSDSSLSGFIVGDEEEEEYEPSEDEEDEEDEEEEEDEDYETDDSDNIPCSATVKAKNLIPMLLKFAEAEDLCPSLDEAEVIAKMVEKGYRFPFLGASQQLRLFPYYQRKKAPPTSLVKSVFLL